MEKKTPKSKKKATAQEDAAMMTVILEKAKDGSVDHAKLLADVADYGPQGVHAKVTRADLEAVLAAMTEKAEEGSKNAARLLPKLQKALEVVKNRIEFISRG